MATVEVDIEELNLLPEELLSDDQLSDLARLIELIDAAVLLLPPTFARNLAVVTRRLAPVFGLKLDDLPADRAYREWLRSRSGMESAA